MKIEKKKKEKTTSPTIFVNPVLPFFFLSFFLVIKDNSHQGFGGEALIT